MKGSQVKGRRWPLEAGDARNAFSLGVFGAPALTWSEAPRDEFGTSGFQNCERMHSVVFVSAANFLLLQSVCGFGGARDRTRGLVY